MPKLKGKSNPNYQHGMFGTRFYNIWFKMKQRTRDKNNPHTAKLYILRGIVTCDRWNDFSNFKKDMYERYLSACKEYGEKKVQIDRIDNDEGYNPANCRWVTSAEQNRNKRSNRYFTYRGVTLVLADWGKIFGFSPSTLWERIYKIGLPFKTAIKKELIIHKGAKFGIKEEK